MNDPREILQDVCKQLMQHPAFDYELYESRDIKAAAETGGDTCDLVCWTWQLEEAMKLLGADQ
jgi:hypothetical protein